MVEDFINRKSELLVGRAMSDIEELLGKPDSTYSRHELGAKTYWTYDIDLGQGILGPPWTSYDLGIVFDEKGWVKAVPGHRTPRSRDTILNYVSYLHDTSYLSIVSLDP